jgi:hypothetical protein
MPQKLGKIEGSLRSKLEKRDMIRYSAALLLAKIVERRRTSISQPQSLAGGTN